jgi:hypothetical protein
VVSSGARLGMKGRRSALRMVAAALTIRVQMGATPAVIARIVDDAEQLGEPPSGP